MILTGTEDYIYIYKYYLYCEKVIFLSTFSEKYVFPRFILTWTHFFTFFAPILIPFECITSIFWEIRDYSTLFNHLICYKLFSIMGYGQANLTQFSN